MLYERLNPSRFKERFGKQDAEKEWKEKVVGAYDFRDQLLHHFRYALRNDESLVKKVSAIADGSSHADMIQDLNDLAILGKDNADKLTAIGVDPTLLDTAATLADELSELYSVVNVDRSKISEDKLIRDKAYVHAKEALDEIRHCGQYVFWRNEDRLKGYTSQYNKR